MQELIIRVLVVDDYAPWRRFVSRTFHTQPELQVIGEASDGFEAVQKAQELQPDLILLDIGLPELNGIEVAQRIREVSSESKILFASQESSVDVVKRALSVGARGYLVKGDAGSELLRAVNAVGRGESFVGRRFAAYDFTGISDFPADPESVRRNEVLAPIEEQNVGITHRHEVELYSDDLAFLEGFTDFVAHALKVGKAVILIATESHQSCLLRRLQAGGVDIAGAIKQKRYIPLDVDDSFQRFVVDGSPDLLRSATGARHLIVEATKEAKEKHLGVAVG